MKKFFTKRTLFIIIIVLGIISGIVLIQYLQKGIPQGTLEESTTEETNSPVLNLSKIKKPNFKTAYPEILQTYDLKSNISPTVSIPSGLSLYKANKSTFDQKDISDIANNLGFTSKPSITKNYTGETVYSYYEGTKNLEVLSNQQIIDLNTGKTYDNPISGSPDRKTIERSVNNYLKEYKLLDENQNVEVVSTQLFRESEDEGQRAINTNTPIIGIATILTEKLNEYPIVTSGSQSGNIEVSLNSKFEVVSLRMSIVPQTTNLGSYPLKNRDQILEALSEATLQEISVSSPDEIYSSAITAITINQVQVIYVPLTDNGQMNIHPVYSLTGLVSFFNGRTAPVTLYLPAISSEYFE